MSAILIPWSVLKKDGSVKIKYFTGNSSQIYLPYRNYMKKDYIKGIIISLNFKTVKNFVEKQ